MSKNLAIYKQGLRYELLLSEDKPLLLSDTDKATFYIQDLSNPIHVGLNEDKVTYQHEDSSGEITDGLEIEGLTFYHLDKNYRMFDLLDRQEIFVSKEVGSDFCIENADFEAIIQKTNAYWQLTLLSGTLYLNNVRMATNTIQLSFGDELSSADALFKFFEDEIWVKGTLSTSQGIVEKSKSNHTFYEEYPDYHRSPRIIYRSSEDSIAVNAPSKEPNKPQDGLLRMVVPPLVMVSVTILISIIQPRGIYILVTMAMSLVTIIFSVTTYFKNRKQYKIDLKKRISSYHRYLSDKAIELNHLAQEQKQGQLYHYPSIEKLKQLAVTYDHRIYEKTPLHFDFLYYRLGLGKVPTTYTLKYSQAERSGQTDPLEAEGYALYKNERMVDNMPIVANLARGPVGYIGPRSLVLEQLQLMVNQLAFFHSYHDVQFITIMPEEELEQWQWMRWLPHATLQDMNVRGFVYNQRTRDQVLNSLTQILKLRRSQQDSKESVESTLFSPHYVVIVTDEKLILDHIIMEFFTEDPTDLGCSVIFVEDVLSSLSENIQTIINIKDRNKGQLVMEEGELKEIDFALDHFPIGYDKEIISRRLAPLNHLQNLKSSIPDSITFMEMYHAEKFEDLQIPKRWSEHAPYKSLAVPIGLRGQDDLVFLNLHEKAHGPHGLIAGTTGSGKSELIQSYILSLAVNFHPHDIAFLLIDYKGGGMANLFKDLPHLLGTITNLDGTQSMRALASINAELKRRQRLFGENDVNHINQYQKKYKLGDVTEPMPHLFLISDEFAELKQNQPDFMTELVSTARIGRSLGIHLILATQKPTGVVNDQIWSNSRFKIALKVANKQDSNEMLHTPDAAEITQTGRAYLQVGNNEVYELFQSAWSGADYQPDKEEQGIEDNTIYAINSLGQYDILNEDLSGLEEAGDIRQVPSELDAIVASIQQLAESMKIEQLPQPWLPPLKERIYLTDLHDVDSEVLWMKPKHDLEVTIGMADVPQEQKQEIVTINLSQDGHVLLYGSPATGKTTFLQTVVLDLAQTHSPEQLSIYLLDFGTNGLAPLMNLPQVADLLLLDQTEKVAKLIRLLGKEISHRKKLLANHGVGTIGMYRKVSQETIPDIVLILDNFESTKGEPIEDDLFKLLLQVAREGLAIGIHLIMTASRQANLRATLFSNFKHQLSLKQNDPTEVRNVVGRTELADIEDIKGRALMKRISSIDSIQFALPVKATNDLQVVERLRKRVLSLSKLWQGKRPTAIPMVPDVLTSEDFYSRPSVKMAIENRQVPLGLDFETVEAVNWEHRKSSFLYLADDERFMIQFAEQLVTLSQLEERYITILAPAYHQLPENIGCEIISNKEDLSEMISALDQKIRERLSSNSRQFVATIIFYDMVSLVEELDGTDLDYLANILEKGHQVGYCSVVISDTGITKKIDVASKVVRASKEGLISMRLTDQNLFNVMNKPVREGQLDSQLHYYILDNQAHKVKVLMRD
ncbi:MAG: type VII secretion protein EssC [Streptococcus sp.]|nr:type VII secretion protein EssC [Streptococcus sp.]